MAQPGARNKNIGVARGSSNRQMPALGQHKSVGAPTSKRKNDSSLQFDLPAMNIGKDGKKAHSLMRKQTLAQKRKSVLIPKGQVGKETLDLSDPDNIVNNSDDEETTIAVIDDTIDHSRLLRSTTNFMDKLVEKGK